MTQNQNREIHVAEEENSCKLAAHSPADERLVKTGVAGLNQGFA
jgi:hypothetical protein